MTAEPLSFVAERDRVLSVYDGSMTEGSQWMVVNADWLQQWAAYVGIDLLTRRPISPLSTKAPPQIDQSRLKDPHFPSIDLLRPSLIEGTDYELVPSAVADLLFSRYAEPSTPTFPRSVISIGLSHMTRVDLYPAFLTIVPLGEEGEEKEEERWVAQFPTSNTWNDVRSLIIQQRHCSSGGKGKEGHSEEHKEEEKVEVSTSTAHPRYPHTPTPPPRLTTTRRRSRD